MPVDGTRFVYGTAADCSCVALEGSGADSFNTVDIFNATNGTWSTAALSVARYGLAATSLPIYGLAMIFCITCAEVAVVSTYAHPG